MVYMKIIHVPQVNSISNCHKTRPFIPLKDYMNDIDAIFLCCTDLLGDNAGGQGNALGFQTYGGQVVTLLASKTSRK